MTAPGPRRVVIQRDPQAPLWFLRCAQPCQPGGPCMGDPRPNHPAICYLGGYGSPEAARAAALHDGWEVVQ